MIIAIDGPAGAGKSTIAREVAQALGFQLVDTGAIYRTVAFLAREQNIALSDADRIADIAAPLQFRFELRGDDNIVFCDDRELGQEIRTAENSHAASIVSAHPAVRAALLDVQRNIARSHDCVLEGRDIGTVVFPDADVKIFLTAAPQVRAQRRTAQLEQAGQPADYDQILREIIERDERDESRAVAPLRKADDAVAVDSSAHSTEEVVQQILAVIRAKRE